MADRLVMVDSNGVLREAIINAEGLWETTVIASGVPTVGSFDVQAVIDGVAQDARQVLSASGTPDQSILIDYTDRVHEKLLRLSQWRFLLSPVKSFETVADQANYWIGSGTEPGGTHNTSLALADLWRIKLDSVVDRTNNRNLTRCAEPPLGAQWAQSGRPSLWRNDIATPYVLNLYQPPKNVFTIEFRYYKAHYKITAVTDFLQIPEQYKDVVIAGVNELVSVYLKRPDEASYWRNVFNEGKIDMIRDTHGYDDRSDFCKGDPNSGGPSYANTSYEQLFQS